jgi:hypothetical protein
MQGVIGASSAVLHIHDADGNRVKDVFSAGLKPGFRIRHINLRSRYCKVQDFPVFHQTEIHPRL